MHEYRNFSLPLSPEQFRHALNAGLGRAKMHLDKFGLSPELREIVLAASISCKVYDPQVEGLPAGWFADFCATAEMLPADLTQNPSERHWDQAWRFALLAQLTLRDCPGAREALYNSLVETSDGDLFGAEDLVEVEGTEGLLFVARRLGRMWVAKAPLAPDDGPLVEFDSTSGEGAALRLLTSEATVDEDIAAYLRVLTAGVSPAPAAPRNAPDCCADVRDDSKLHRESAWPDVWGAKFLCG